MRNQINFFVLCLIVFSLTANGMETSQSSRMFSLLQTAYKSKIATFFNPTQTERINSLLSAARQNSGKIGIAMGAVAATWFGYKYFTPFRNRIASWLNPSERKIQPTNNLDTIDIKTFNGDIEIDVHEKDYISLTVEKTKVFSGLKNISIKSEQQGSLLKITSMPLSSDISAKIDYKLLIPSILKLKKLSVTLTNGNSTLKNIGANNVDVVCQKGKVCLQNLMIENNLTTQLKEGTITAANIIAKAFKAELQTGNIYFTNDIIDFPGEFSTKTGDIQIIFNTLNVKIEKNGRSGFSSYGLDYRKRYIANNDDHFILWTGADEPKPFLKLSSEKGLISCVQSDNIKI